VAHDPRRRLRREFFEVLEKNAFYFLGGLLVVPVRPAQRFGNNFVYTAQL
jgi:hypothetical protein